MPCSRSALPRRSSVQHGRDPGSTQEVAGQSSKSAPQASVAAVGAHAAEIVAHQALGFALGRTSPFGRLHDLGAYILLIGVGHNRNTFLHHAETLTPCPRLKVRRFPHLVNGERVWVETLDVANDNDTFFPIVGEEFEAKSDIEAVQVGAAACRLIPTTTFGPFAVQRLTELLPRNS